MSGFLRPIIQYTKRQTSKVNKCFGCCRLSVANPPTKKQVRNCCCCYCFAWILEFFYDTFYTKNGTFSSSYRLVVKQLQKYGIFSESVTQHLPTHDAEACSSFQGDVPQLSPPMKSAAVQSSFKPYNGQSTADSAVMAPLTSSQPNSGMGSSTVNTTGGTYPPSSIYPPVRPTTVPQATYLSPGPSIQPHPPQYSLSPGLSPPWGDQYPKSQLGAARGASPSSLFAPKTAAELGLLARPTRHIV